MQRYMQFTDYENDRLLINLDHVYACGYRRDRHGTYGGGTPPVLFLEFGGVLQHVVLKDESLVIQSANEVRELGHRVLFASWGINPDKTVWMRADRIIHALESPGGEYTTVGLGETGDPNDRRPDGLEVAENLDQLQSHLHQLWN